MSVTVSFAALGVQNEQPDVVVEKGEKFVLKCNARSLSRLVKTKLDQRWIHNSSTFKEFQDVRPENKDNFKITSSNYSDSGIWTCRYISKSFNLPSREWATSVTRVLVIPPRSFLQKLLPYVLAIIVCLSVIAIIAWIYWRRIKKKKQVAFEEELEEEYEDYDEDYDEDYEY